MEEGDATGPLLETAPTLDAGASMRSSGSAIDKLGSLASAAHVAQILRARVEERSLVQTGVTTLNKALMREKILAIREERNARRTTTSIAVTEPDKALMKVLKRRARRGALQAVRGRGETETNAVLDWVYHVPENFMLKIPRETALSICATITLRACAPGEVVFSQGDPGDAYFMVLSGKVAIVADASRSGKMAAKPVVKNEAATAADGAKGSGGAEDKEAGEEEEDEEEKKTTTETAEDDDGTKKAAATVETSGRGSPTATSTLYPPPVPSKRSGREQMSVAGDANATGPGSTAGLPGDDSSSEDDATGRGGMPPGMRKPRRRRASVLEQHVLRGAVAHVQPARRLRTKGSVAQPVRTWGAQPATAATNSSTARERQASGLATPKVTSPAVALSPATPQEHMTPAPPSALSRGRRPASSVRARRNVAAGSGSAVRPMSAAKAGGVPEATPASGASSGDKAAAAVRVPSPASTHAGYGAEQTSRGYAAGQGDDSASLSALTGARPTSGVSGHQPREYMSPGESEMGMERVRGADVVADMPARAVDTATYSLSGDHARPVSARRQRPPSGKRGADSESASTGRYSRQSSRRGRDTAGAAKRSGDSETGSSGRTPSPRTRQRTLAEDARRRVLAATRKLSSVRALTSALRGGGTPSGTQTPRSLLGSVRMRGPAAGVAGMATPRTPLSGAAGTPRSRLPGSGRRLLGHRGSQLSLSHRTRSQRTPAGSVRGGGVGGGALRGAQRVSSPETSSGSEDSASVGGGSRGFSGSESEDTQEMVQGLPVDDFLIGLDEEEEDRVEARRLQRLRRRGVRRDVVDRVVRSLGKLLVELGPRTGFGELALFGDGGRNASVVAVEPTELLVIRRVHYTASVQRQQQRALTEKMTFLRGVPLFASWSRKRLLRVAYSMEKVPFRFNKHIVRSAEPVTHVYFVMQGEVRVSVPLRLEPTTSRMLDVARPTAERGHNGVPYGPGTHGGSAASNPGAAGSRLPRKVDLSVLSRGALVGHIAVMAKRGTYGIDAVAGSDVETLSMKKSAFLELLRTSRDQPSVREFTALTTRHAAWRSARLAATGRFIIDTAESGPGGRRARGKHDPNGHFPGDDSDATDSDGERDPLAGLDDGHLQNGGGDPLYARTARLAAGSARGERAGESVTAAGARGQAVSDLEVVRLSTGVEIPRVAIRAALAGSDAGRRLLQRAAAENDRRLDVALRPAPPRHAGTTAETGVDGSPRPARRLFHIAPEFVPAVSVLRAEVNLPLSARGRALQHHKLRAEEYKAVLLSGAGRRHGFRHHERRGGAEAGGSRRGGRPLARSTPNAHGIGNSVTDPTLAHTFHKVLLDNATDAYVSEHWQSPNC